MTDMRLDAPGDPNARMDAYYYSFNRTGIGIIDAILSAVATAGKRYHHTDRWADPWQAGEKSEAESIQEAADAAAEAIRKHVSADRAAGIVRVDLDAPATMGLFASTLLLRTVLDPVQSAHAARDLIAALRESA